MKEGLNIGSAIQKIRKEKGFKNQLEFCNKVGIDQPYFSQVENDKRTPSLPYLNKIAKALGVPMFFFFWFNVVSEDDISEEKKFTFKVLKPKIDDMLVDIFQKQ